MTAQSHSSQVILCVDYKEAGAQLTLFKRVLERAGYRVLAAMDAGEALEILSRNDIDLVLTEHIDVKTGETTLAGAMKRFKPDVPIAIYSADLSPSPEDMKFAEMFITKLIGVEELLRTIERLLAKSPTSQVSPEQPQNAVNPGRSTRSKKQITASG